MGEVYRARDTRLNRDVALKVLPDDFARDPARRQRFEQEARAVAALNHPNIVAVYDVGKNFLVSELVDGQTLRAGGKLSQRRAIDLAVQIAEGIAAAHAAGITHRDLDGGSGALGVKQWGRKGGPRDGSCPQGFQATRLPGTMWAQARRSAGRR